MRAIESVIWRAIVTWDVWTLRRKRVREVRR